MQVMQPLPTESGDLQTQKKSVRIVPWCNVNGWAQGREADGELVGQSRPRELRSERDEWCDACQGR